MNKNDFVNSTEETVSDEVDTISIDDLKMKM